MLRRRVRGRVPDGVSGEITERHSARPSPSSTHRPPRRTPVEQSSSLNLGPSQQLNPTTLLTSRPMFRLVASPRALSQSSASSRLALQSRGFRNSPRRLAESTPTPPPSGPPPIHPPLNVTPPAKTKPFYRRHPYAFAFLVSPLVITGSALAVIGGLLAYDATTYADKHVDNVPDEVMHFELGRGGKKNLKIADHLVDDDDPSRRACGGKQRLVIVGGGWGVS